MVKITIKEYLREHGIRTRIRKKISDDSEDIANALAVICRHNNITMDELKEQCQEAEEAEADCRRDVLELEMDPVTGAQPKMQRMFLME